MILQEKSKTKFKFLFSPIQIGNKTYQNRVAATPLGNVMIRPDGTYPQSAFDLYVKKASGGCAEVSVSETPVDFEYANRMPMPAVDYRDYDSPHMKSLRTYTEMLHSYGAIATVELCHCGQWRLQSAGENGPIGPSQIVRSDGVLVREMDEALMAKTAENFAQCAYYMKQAGFDGVMPHMASAWLLQQFFSPLTNHRKDEYGGSLENRARFPLRVLRAIRERCGEDFLIIPRLCVDEGVPGGYGIEDSIALCKRMEGLVDMVHIMRGVYYDPIHSGEFSSVFSPHNINAQYGWQIKQACSIPVMVSGGINSPEEADRMIEQGEADLIGLGRQMLADPNWAKKARENNEADIARCIRCFRCFPGPLQEGATPTAPPDKKCSINPLSDLSELNPPIADWPEPKSAKKVLVVGGGVAGMTAAYTAAQRGHAVTLAERSGKLGGLVNHSDVDSHKQDMHNFKELCIRRCHNAGVNILLNTEVTAQNIQSFHPDAVILALGSTPATPPIPGIETAVQALDVYWNPSLLGKNVVMCGGGLVGCECALNMVAPDRKITLVEMRNELAVDDYKMHRIALLNEIERSVDVRTGYQCLSIQPNGVHCKDGAGNQVFLEADTVVYAMGMKANSALADELEAAVCGKAEVYRIGDCIRAAKIQNAVEEGFLAAMKII